MLVLSAAKLGIPMGVGMNELLERILAGVHRGGLDPLSYRVVWTLARGPRRDAPRDETAASNA